MAGAETQQAVLMFNVCAVSFVCSCIMDSVIADRSTFLFVFFSQTKFLQCFLLSVPFTLHLQTSLPSSHAGTCKVKLQSLAPLKQLGAECFAQGLNSTVPVTGFISQTGLPRS